MPAFLMTLDRRGDDTLPESFEVTGDRDHVSRSMGELWNRRAPSPDRGWRLRLRPIMGRKRNGAPITGPILETIG